MTFVLLLVPAQIFAWGECCESWTQDISLNARVAYFHPNSDKVRKIYSEGWPEYQLELSKGFCQNWQAWAGVAWSSKKGRSLGLHDETRLRLLPISLGVKYLWCVYPDTKFYLGAGVCYSMLHIKDHSPFVHEKVSKNAFGGIVQSGLYYDINCMFFVNVFFDYYFQRFDFSNRHHSGSGSGSSSFVERHNADLSGYKTGAGIGVNF